MEGQGIVQDGATPVSFDFGPAEHGWIDLTVRAGGDVDVIRCSNAYDPFPHLAAWATQVALGYLACLEIDEEGRQTEMWLSREPGSRKALLRVFEPGDGGKVDAMRIEATVDAIQVAKAFHDAFSAYRETYDRDGWDVMGPLRGPKDDPLGAIDIRRLGQCIAARTETPSASA